MQDTSYESLSLRIENFIAEVTLTGPGKGNAFGPSSFRELPEVFERVAADEQVRAVVLRGNEGVFSFGLDLKAVSPTLMPLLSGQGLAKERTALYRLIRDWQRSADSIEACSKPVIAAIAGPCIGMGVDLAAACDVRLATPDAVFSVREVRVAIVADLGSLQRLPRIIGQGATRELAFTGSDISADRAKSLGLVNELFSNETELFAGAHAMAQRIAQNPPLVVQGIKQVLNHGHAAEVREAERFAAVWNSAFMASHDLGEAVAAFMQKRSPSFEGR